MIAMNYVFTATHPNDTVRQFTDEPIGVSQEKPHGSYYADHTFFGMSSAARSPTEAIRSLIDRRGFTLMGCMPVVEHITRRCDNCAFYRSPKYIAPYCAEPDQSQPVPPTRYCDNWFAGTTAQQTDTGQALRDKQAEVDRICDKLTGLQREMGVLRDALDVAEQERDELRAPVSADARHAELQQEIDEIRSHLNGVFRFMGR